MKRLLLLPKVKTISRKNTRSFQPHKKLLMVKALPSFINKSILSWGINWISIRATAWRVCCKLIKSLTQVVQQQWQVQRTSTLVCMGKIPKPKKKCQICLKDSLIRLMPMPCLSKEIASRSSVKIQMLSSMVWRLSNTCWMKVQHQSCAM